LDVETLLLPAPKLRESADLKQRRSEMDLITWLPLIMRILSLIPVIQESFRTGTSVIDSIQKTVPEVLPILQEIGTKAFPTLTDPALAKQAGADVVFDTQGTMWVQNNINAFNKNTALTVDGIYGPKTTAAVKAYQVLKGMTGDDVDGWSGPKTSGLLAVDVSKLEVTP